MTEDRSDLFGKRLQIVTKLKSLIVGELSSVDASRQTLTLTDGTVVSSQNPTSVRKFAVMVIDASNVQTIEEALSQRPADPAVVEMRTHNGSLAYAGEGDRKFKKGFPRRDQLAHFDLAFSSSEQRQRNSGTSEASEATHKFARSSSVPPESFFRGPPSAYQPTTPRGRYTPKRSNALTRLRVSRSTFNKVVVRRNFVANNPPLRRNSDCDLVAQTKEFDDSRRSLVSKTPSLNAPTLQKKMTFFDEEIVASKENATDGDAFLQSIVDKTMPCDDLPTEYISEPSYSKKSFFDNLLVTSFTAKKSNIAKLSAGEPARKLSDTSALKSGAEKDVVKSESKGAGSPSGEEREFGIGERSPKSRTSGSISGRNFHDLNAETFGVDSVRAYRLNAPYAKRTGDASVDRDGSIKHQDINRNGAPQKSYRQGFFTSYHSSSFDPHATSERFSQREVSTSRKKTLQSRFASDSRAYNWRAYVNPQALNYNYTYRYSKVQTGTNSAPNVATYGGYPTDIPRSILKNRNVPFNHSRLSGQHERTKLKVAGLGFSSRYAYPQPFCDTTYFKRGNQFSGSSNAFRFDAAGYEFRKRRNLEGRQARFNWS